MGLEIGLKNKGHGVRALLGKAIRVEKTWVEGMGFGV
jgi:hypothetical protein